MSSPSLKSKKILSPRALATRLKKLKRATPVFTNGCYDLLHVGHISLLTRAKRLGTHLIVALNSDDSVRRLEKGPGRPLNTLADRLQVIAALEAVDFVTWFDDDTPLELIRQLKPRVLVKGGDWRVDQIIGAAEVLARKGKVKSLPFIAGKSTTQLIQKARGQN